jgi:FAD/FMN-containing dehydrogenase
MIPGSIANQLTDTLHGRVLQPDHADYDEARAIWNGMIDRHPALIVQCKSPADVMAAVNFAGEHHLPLTVKAGGHSIAGKSIYEDGLVVDVSAMNGVRVDPDAQRARVGPGATWGDFDREAQAFGLATTGGVDSRTGVAGLTLGGGLGYLARKYGLAIDNLLAVDVVTADGELRRASADKNPDLFWALRGGGGNVGIVTSFEFQLHEVGPKLLVAQIFHPYEHASSVLRYYRDFMMTAPDEVSCYALIAHVPPAPPFPEAYQGKPAVALVGCYAGPVAAGQEALAPLTAYGDPILNAVQPMPYTTLQSSFDAGYPNGARYYWKSQYLSELSDAAIDTVVQHGTSLPGALTAGGFEAMGGAVNQVETTATAFPHRHAAFNFSIFAGWTDPEDDEEIIAWTKAFHEAVAPYATGGTYLNYLDRDDDRSAAYGPNHERLLAIKRAWDPDNLFRMNPVTVPAA